MGIFNDIGTKATETTNKIKQETKLKFKINDNKSKILDVYEEIGKKVYEKHVREENIDIKNDLKEECEKIDKLSNEIEIARNEILKLNKKMQCHNCYAEIDCKCKFCPECGAKQNNNETAKNEALDELENSEISPENKEEAEIVKDELENNITE